MSLSEIYGMSAHYFELKVSNAIPAYGIQYDQYYGAALRENGTKIFTIKEDDRWANTYGDHSKFCNVCGEGSEASNIYTNRLGPYWFEEHTEYVRPHP